MENSKRGPGRPKLPKNEMVPTLVGEIYKVRTSKPTKEERVALIEECVHYYKEIFQKMGVEKPKFFPKNTFPIGNTQHVALFLDSEFNVEPHGFFTEFVDSNYNLKNPTQRVLFHLPYNPNRVKENYILNKKNEFNGEQYFVPVTEFEPVNIMKLILDETRLSHEKEVNEKPHPVQTNVPQRRTVQTSTPSVVNQEPEDLDERKDDHIEKMTIRDKCAIEWGKPVSNKEWLNEMIREQFPESNNN